MMLFIYVSSATKQLTDDELFHLLKKSRARNKALNITGILLYSGGNFLQVLSGNKSDLEEVYSSILQDKRNFGHIVLIEEEIEDHYFPDWSMAFRAINTGIEAESEGFSEFLNKKIRSEDVVIRGKEIMVLLNEFKRNNL
jgi:hypothetical protein